MHIDLIELSTTDLVAAKQFYHLLLGFPLLEETDTMLSIATGSSVLSFVKSEMPAFYHVAFLIPSNQVQEAMQWVNSKTDVLPFTPSTRLADFKNWNAEAFYFHDHQQNFLEFIAHHDLDNNSATPFSGASIIRICEIGLPVSSVSDACAHFNEAHDIPYFVKRPRLPDFAVMGDVEGLLIVTTIGRGWLPTQRPAEQHPVHIQLTHNGRRLVLPQAAVLR
jgi:catechol 2,3-dioxygenase-like lactoylglutathione lyase family enzyme